jgi:hypothetical protein
VTRRGSSLERLRGIVRVETVTQEPEYVGRTAEERRVIVARLFGQPRD